jgi:hypothetical protein
MTRQLSQASGELIMFIIVKHLNSGVTVDSLERFVKPCLKGGLFRKKAELKAIQITALVDKKGMVVERHGLIRIAPDSEKPRLIKALNDKGAGHMTFAVDEYVIRHWSNDRRAGKHYSDRYPNRRSNDRRRVGLRMFTMSEKLEF